ncbi:hypothetical protein C6500_14325 [Candidatus Poribacteria bacterium]|nr:MAG: hypothetical protein C6500_14325 [Candidatus Poribacteria bacterium]
MSSTIMRILTCAVLMIIFCLVAPQIWSREAVLFEEDFEGVTLEASIMEQVKDKNVWSGTPPEGWEITNENPKDLGMPEWRTWAIVDLEWWTRTAEDQRRSEFTGVHNDGKGIGKGAVSDPDEWDDWEGNGDPDAQSRWNGHLITPPIKIKGAAAKSLVLTLDSSWRPEDTQNGEITVSFDDGKEEQILFFKSVGIDAGAHTLVTIPTLKLKEEKINDGEQINETLEIPIDNPAGVTEMTISFGVIDAQNDWWWAIDNIKLISTAFDIEPRDKLALKWAEIKRLQ